MIRIFDSGLVGLGAIKNTHSSNRFEALNGENTLDFSATFEGRIAEFVNENTVYELDGEYFDTAVLTKSANDDGTFSVDVEAEHVSYRLNKPDYNVDFFTELGLPSYVLGKVLEGTGFTVGTVDFNTTITYSAQEAKSRRQLLMELGAYLGGEVSFNNFQVNILTHRGSTNITTVIKDRNIKIVSKTVNKRQKDKDGNDLVSYICTPIFIPGDSYALGDDVALLQKTLGLSERLRVVSISRNPYDEAITTFEFANYVNGLESQLFRIETNTLAKGKLYYGARISPENGFESIRNDLKARTVMNADKFEMQVGDGTGQWIRKLWFDPELNLYVFDGTLSADTIEAIKAEIDVVISQAIITSALAAQKATIAELTVDRINTSDKVGNYLNSDTSDVFYTRMQDQILEWVEAKYNASLPLVHSTDRYGVPIYWVDQTHTGWTYTETSYPVMEYGYDEFVKRKDWFVTDPSGSGYKIPISEWGVGTGVGDNAKFRMYKGTKGAYFDYYHSITGNPIRFMLTDNGIDFSECVDLNIVYPTGTVFEGVTQMFVAPEMPAAAKQNDLLASTTDSRRFEILYGVGAVDIYATDPEMIDLEISGANFATAGATDGCYKRIMNNTSNILSYSGVQNGPFYIMPGDIHELLYYNGGWRRI